jgi:hypothetical protein
MGFVMHPCVGIDINTIDTFYHELDPALIFLSDLPISPIRLEFPSRHEIRRDGQHQLYI